MQQRVNSYVSITQAGEDVRCDIEAVCDVRPDSATPWKRGEVESGPAYVSCVTMPGKTDLLDQEFLNRVGRDFREVVESRMKRALVY